MKNSSIRFVLMLLLVCFLACEDDGNTVPLDGLATTFEIISASPDHTVLKNLLEESGLDEVLNAGTYTVFAPVDAAFQNLDLSNLSEAELSNLLLYHVLQGNATSINLSNRYFDTEAKVLIDDEEFKLSLLVTLSNAIFINGTSEVITQDVEASNGTIHMVNEVLTIPSLKEMIGFDPNLNSLEAALTTEGQPDYMSQLSISATSSPAPFTVLVPTNAAFDTALSLLGVENLEQIESDLLTQVLNLHVLTEVQLRNGDFSEQGLETLGGTVAYNAENNQLIDANDRLIDFSIVNVQATNGVMHVIQDVILIETELQDPVDTTNQVSFTLDNEGSTAYFVTEINGNEEVTMMNENNATWILTVGTRYTITVVNAANHPLELRDENNEALLSQSEAIEGLFEADTNVNFQVEGNQISFTLTPGLAGLLTSYACSIHPSMAGEININ